MKKLLPLLVIPFLSIGQGQSVDCMPIGGPWDFLFDVWVFNSSNSSCEQTLFIEFQAWESEECCCQFNPCVWPYSLIENLNSNKSKKKIVNLFGAETNNNKGFQLHIYNDGSVEKKYLIE